MYLKIKGNQIAEGRHSAEPERYMSPVSSLLKWWLCAVLFGLYPCDCGQEGRHGFFGNLKKKFNIRLSVSVFLFYNGWFEVRCT